MRQILVLDVIFSLGSVITAIVVAVAVKMLALSFLLLVGMTLIADGFGQHVPKGYIYCAMGFSVLVEMLNLRIRSAEAGLPVRLRHPGPRPRTTA